MSLAERLSAARKPLKSAFEAWIDELPAAEREALLAAALDPQLSNMAIAEAVRAEGCTVHRDTISAWRKSHGFAR